MVRKRTAPVMLQCICVFLGPIDPIVYSCIKIHVSKMSTFTSLHKENSCQYGLCNCFKMQIYDLQSTPLLAPKFVSFSAIHAVQVPFVIPLLKQKPFTKLNFLARRKKVKTSPYSIYIYVYTNQIIYLLDPFGVVTVIPSPFRT